MCAGCWISSAWISIPRCLSFHENQRYARTASYAQVTEKLYDSSRSIATGNYRKYLDEAVEILKPCWSGLGIRIEFHFFCGRGGAVTALRHLVHDAARRSTAGRLPSAASRARPADIRSSGRSHRDVLGDREIDAGLRCCA